MERLATDGDIEPLRDAATLVLLREPDGAAGSEVLLLRRHRASRFAGGAWVFPGGAVDAADRELPAGGWCGFDPVTVATRLRTRPAAAVGFHVAAIREAFEEAGILLAVDANGASAAPHEARRRRLRATNVTPRPDLATLLDRTGATLDVGALVALSRWMTPRIPGRRFDTVFFCALAPCDQPAVVDGDEIVDSRWVSPAAALEASRAGELELLYPTVKTLEWLARHRGVHETLRAAGAASIEPLLPHFERRDGKLRVLLPDEEGYPDELRVEIEARR